MIGITGLFSLLVAAQAPSYLDVSIKQLTTTERDQQARSLAMYFGGVAGDTINQLREETRENRWTADFYVIAKWDFPPKKLVSNSCWYVTCLFVMG